MNDHHEKRSGRGQHEKDQHEKRSGSGQHEKRSGSGQHEKETGSGHHEKRSGSSPWPLTFDPWPLPFDLNTKKANLNYCHSIHWSEWIFHFKLIKFNFKQVINFIQFLILTTNVKHWARVPNSATLYTNFQRACTGGLPPSNIFLIVIFLFREVLSIFWRCPHIHTTKFANYHTPLLIGQQFLSYGSKQLKYCFDQ